MKIRIVGASAIVMQRLNYFECFILCEGHPMPYYPAICGHIFDFEATDPSSYGNTHS